MKRLQMDKKDVWIYCVGSLASSINGHIGNGKARPLQRARLTSAHRPEQNKSDDEDQTSSWTMDAHLLDRSQAIGGGAASLGLTIGIQQRRPLRMDLVADRSGHVVQ